MVSGKFGTVFKKPSTCVMARRAEQARQAGRLDALQRTLEGKEAEMARLAGGEGRVSALKAQFDAALAELAAERNALQRERGQLVQVPLGNDLCRPSVLSRRCQLLHVGEPMEWPCELEWCARIDLERGRCCIPAVQK